MNWVDELDDEAKSSWDKFVAYQREHTLKMMSDSAMVISIVPDDDLDVKFCVELGMAIMLNKPILAIVQPGAKYPEKLRRVANQIVEADVDTEEGKSLIMRAIMKIQLK